MAIVINISKPENFLEVLNKEIDDGVVTSWRYDEDGDYTITNSEYANKAWLHPYIQNDELIFGIMGRKNVLLTITEYSLYHSAMVETLVLHFSDIIREIRVIQPLLSDYDTHSIDYKK